MLYPYIYKNKNNKPMVSSGLGLLVAVIGRVKQKNTAGRGGGDYGSAVSKGIA
jgi:hypothetical protein